MAVWRIPIRDGGEPNSGLIDSSRDTAFGFEPPLASSSGAKGFVVVYPGPSSGTDVVHRSSLRCEVHGSIFALVPKEGTKEIASGSFASVNDPSSPGMNKQGFLRFGTKRVLSVSLPRSGTKQFVSLASPKNSVGPRPVSYTHLTLPTNREV